MPNLTPNRLRATPGPELVPGAADGPVTQRVVRRPAAAPAPRVMTVVRWAFYLFVFSIPLEYPDRTIPLEVHTITGSLFLLVALLQPRLCFRRPPAALLWFSAYLWIYVALGLFSQHPAETMKLFFNYLLVACVFWAACNLMRFDAIARKAFLGFVVGAVVIGILQRAGIATSEVEGRLAVFGQDANLLGGNMAVGLLMVIALGYSRDRVPMRKHVLVGVVGLLLLRTLLYSASRGAALAFVIGLVAFAFRAGDPRKIVRHVAIAVLAGAVLMAAAYRNESLLKRYQETLSTGDLSGREQIYPEAMKMFRERPLLGWGPINHQYELGIRTSGFQIGARNADGVAVHAFRDTHDVVLDILTSVGLIGAFPFFAAIAACLWGAWRARRGPRGTLPLALAICALAVGLSINVAASKQLWLLLAYAAASGSASRLPRAAALRRPRLAVIAT